MLGSISPRCSWALFKAFEVESVGFVLSSGFRSDRRGGGGERAGFVPSSSPATSAGCAVAIGGVAASPSAGPPQQLISLGEAGLLGTHSSSHCTK